MIRVVLWQHIGHCRCTIIKTSQWKQQISSTHIQFSKNQLKTQVQNSLFFLVQELHKRTYVLYLKDPSSSWPRVVLKQPFVTNGVVKSWICQENGEIEHMISTKDRNKQILTLYSMSVLYFLKYLIFKKNRTLRSLVKYSNLGDSLPIYILKRTLLKRIDLFDSNKET